jgi:hypothetical protein
MQQLRAAAPLKLPLLACHLHRGTGYGHAAVALEHAAIAAVVVSTTAALPLYPASHPQHHQQCRGCALTSPALAQLGACMTGVAPPLASGADALGVLLIHQCPIAKGRLVGQDDHLMTTTCPVAWCSPAQEMLKAPTRWHSWSPLSCWRTWRAPSVTAHLLLSRPPGKLMHAGRPGTWRHGAVQ